MADFNMTETDFDVQLPNGLVFEAAENYGQFSLVDSFVRISECELAGETYRGCTNPNLCSHY